MILMQQTGAIITASLMKAVGVLGQPAWWDLRHTLGLVGIMTLILLAAALWAMTLRRRLREQTRVIQERLEKEAALEQRYREIFDGANDLIFTHDREGRVTSLNPAGRRVLGYEPEEVKQLTFDRILTPASREQFRHLCEVRSADSSPATCELELVTRNGGHVWVEASARVIVKDGRATGGQAIARDISERKQTEAALQQSERKFRSLVERSLVGVYVIQEERFVYVNPRFAEIFGYTPTEISEGLTVQELTTEEDWPLVKEQIRRRIAHEDGTVHYHFRGRRKDGSALYVEAMGSGGEYDGRPAVLGTLLDITERQQTEAALAEASSLLTTLLENLPDSIYFKDRQSRFVHYSKTFLKLLKVSDAGALLGKTDFDLFAEEHARLAYEDEQEIIRTGKPIIGKLERETHRNGAITWCLSTKMPWRDVTGQTVGTFGISKDVTAIKEAEDKLAYERELFRVLVDNLPDNIYFKDRESRFVRVGRSKAESTLAAVRSSYLAQHPDATANGWPEHLASVEAFAEYLIGRTDFDTYEEAFARRAFKDEQTILKTGQPLIGNLERLVDADGSERWLLVTKMPWRDPQGNIIGTFGVSRNITDLKQAEQQLAHERKLFRVLLDTLPDAIYFKDRESRFVRLSRSKVERTRRVLLKHFHETQSSDSAPLPGHLLDDGECGEYLIGRTDFDVYPEPRARDAYEEEQWIIRTGEPLIGKVESTVQLDDGKSAWYLTTKMPWRDEEGAIIGTFGVTRDITPLKQAETQLQEAHQRLVETSRLAGMAEVATDVLHNVGNVLNSVNVSCSLTADLVKNSRLSGLLKVTGLLAENRSRLAEFLVQDPRGRQIPEYLSALADHLRTEQEALLKELEQLGRHVDHIKQIVAMQQSYAKVAGVLEQVSPAQLVEDALQINAAALSRHAVQVRREWGETPPIITEKHKVLQILVNLIRNAKYALDEAERPDKWLTIRLGANGHQHVKIQVTDNGIGIPAENLTRIFSHGFTTRRNGHGFGLHSSALAVRELGGTLQAHSDGPGQGASFTLLLPPSPPSQSPQPL